ncbi:hypothetical protein [Cellulosimicrobium cellulans]|uniref:hypothetical protein n=1 Tax=Cellulosimicrobium cellulans TaxID=1710 RepID=UPI00130E58BD|nr:hypothetical protein [Cellulosimicrobium cellulans]
MPSQNTADRQVTTPARVPARDASARSSARDRARGMLLGWPGEALAVALLGSAMVAHAFRWDIDRLRAPLGMGDLLYAYATAHMWGRGAPFGDDSLGFPAGMHLPYYPTGDAVHNALAGFFAQFTQDPFLPLNLVLATSFPLTALAGLWLLRLVGLRGPLAVVAALGLTAIPFHWLRPDHVYLATMYPAVLAVVLALLVGSGQLARAWRERRVVVLGASAVAMLLVGAGGIYYACFAILLIACAALYRVFRGARWRVVLGSLIPAAIVTLVLGATLLPSALWAGAHPATGDVAQRYPVESVMYSGSLSMALLPTPFSDLPGAGALGDLAQSMYEQATLTPTSGVLVWSNSGSVFTMIAIAFVAVGAFVVSRRRMRASRAPVEDETGRVPLSLVLGLLVAAVLFFVPWGLNFLFSFLVTPQLRGWDRLVPVLFALVVAAAGVVWRDLGWSTGGRLAWGVSAVLAVVVVLDSVTPYRASYDALVDPGLSELAAGRTYAEALDAEVPEECGVLQLPYVATPEVADVEGLGNYEHLVPALTNPGKDWSFGAIKATPDSALPEEIGSRVEPEELDELRDTGFCAVHVDWRGYTAEEAVAVRTELDALLGDPVATGHGDDWSAYALDR